MFETHLSVTIERPAGVVFAFVSDAEKDTLWQSGVIESRQVSEGPLGVGTRLVEVRKVAGRHMESALIVTAHDPGHMFAVKSTSGPVEVDVTVTCEGASATHLRFDSIVRLRGIFRVIEPLFDRVFRSQTRAELRKLKDMLESGSTR